MKHRTLQVLLKVCRRQGIRMTQQRRVILEALAGRDDHPTADMLYEEVQALLPDVSKTTVYRTLDMLVSIGVARNVCHPGSTTRFEAMTTRHHHLVCLWCNRLIDVVDHGLDNIQLPETRRLGFRIDDYSIQFRGICSECSRESGGSPHRKTNRRM